MPKNKKNINKKIAEKPSKKLAVAVKTTKKEAKKSKAGLIVNVLSLSGRTTRVSLPEKIFKTKIKPATLAQVIRVYLTNQRKGSVKVKTRSEVSGGGRKPWRQKGTGRARQGSIRAPHWRGGGVVFGPTPRIFLAKVPAKVKQKAFFGVLTEKLAADQIRVIDGFENIKPETREFVKAIGKLNLPADKKSLFVFGQNSKNLVQAGRNLPTFEFCNVSNLTTYQVVQYPFLIFTKEALSELERKIN